MTLFPIFVYVAAAMAGAFDPSSRPVDAPPPDTDLTPQKLVPPVPARFGAIWENDSSYHTGFDSDDRDYTEGLRLDLSWQPAWADRWAKAVPLADQFSPMRTAVGVALGQNLYTPDDLAASAPIPNQHPYGAWLYSGFYLQRADERTFDTAELDVGVTGRWAEGENTQKFVHRVVNSGDPKGWQNQKGNEVGADLVLERRWKLGAGRQDGWRAEVVPYAGATVGTIFLNAIGGATFRAGYNMTDDFGSSRIGHVGDQGSAPARGLGGYAFVRLGGRAVGHDSFLDGSLFPSDDPSVGHEPLVGEVQAGVALRLTSWLDVAYSQTWWSKEFDHQNGEHFGAVSFSIHFDF